MQCNVILYLQIYNSHHLLFLCVYAKATTLSAPYSHKSNNLLLKFQSVSQSSRLFHNPSAERWMTFDESKCELRSWCEFRLASLGLLSPNKESRIIWTQVRSTCGSRESHSFLAPTLERTTGSVAPQQPLLCLSSQVGWGEANGKSPNQHQTASVCCVCRRKASFYCQRDAAFHLCRHENRAQRLQHSNG